MPNYKINSKTIARIAAIQALYQFFLEENNSAFHNIVKNMLEVYSSDSANEALNLSDKDTAKLKLAVGFYHELVTVAYENIETVDHIVNKYLNEGWTIQRMQPLVTSIVRTGIAELKYFPETPFKVIINEYSNISASFFEDSEVSFVNSVLDKFAKEQNAN